MSTMAECYARQTTPSKPKSSQLAAGAHLCRRFTEKLWSKSASCFDPESRPIQSGTYMDSFESIGLNARCILEEWSLDRNSAHVSHWNLRILWSAHRT